MYFLSVQRYLIAAVLQGGNAADLGLISAEGLLSHIPDATCPTHSGSTIGIATANVRESLSTHLTDFLPLSAFPSLYGHICDVIRHQIHGN